MGVRVYNCLDRTFPSLRLFHFPIVEVKPRFCGFFRDEGVNDDEAFLSFDDGHVRKIKPANLVDAVHDLEQPAFGIELGNAP